MQIFFANGIGFIKISAQLFSQIISHFSTSSHQNLYYHIKSIFRENKLRISDLLRRNYFTRKIIWHHSRRHLNE